MSRILVIEDNPQNLDLMVYLLTKFGHIAARARDGVEGLEAMRREKPDLVICDLQMPRMDGYEVARHVRNDPQLRELGLLAVTAYAMRGDREKVLAAGFDGYITKPIVPRDFVNQVNPFLQGSIHATPRPQVATAEPSPGVPGRPTILVVDNAAANLSLMQSILQPSGYDVITASSVTTALDILRRSVPDLILSDLHLPEKDGYCLLDAVKSNPDLASIPFAFISSTVWTEADPRLALTRGACKFILRPIGPQALLSEIEDCLRKARAKHKETR